MVMVGGQAPKYFPMRLEDSCHMNFSRTLVFFQSKKAEVGSFHANFEHLIFRLQFDVFKCVGRGGLDNTDAKMT